MIIHLYYYIYRSRKDKVTAFAEAFVECYNDIYAQMFSKFICDAKIFQA